MICSKRINDLNKRIHELLREEKDVSMFAFSKELHELLARRNNLNNQLLKEQTNSFINKEIKKSLMDFEVL